MKHLVESISSRKTGKYGSGKPFPNFADLLDLGPYLDCLEDHGFTWIPFNNKKMEKDHLNQVYGSGLHYTDGPEDLDSGLYQWFAFGNEDRVYMIWLEEFFKNTRRTEYGLGVYQKNGICVHFQTYDAFSESAKKYFGLK